MIRSLLAVVLLLLPALAAARPGLFYIVTDPAGEPAAWVYATLPSSDPRIRRLPSPVERALDRADGLVVGVRPDAVARREVAAASQLPPGEDLRDQLGLSLFARAHRALEGSGLSREELARLQPWAVALALATPTGLDPAGPVLPLVQRARRIGLPIHGLESASEHIAALAGLSLPDKVGLIAHLIEFRPRLGRWQARQEAAWLEQDPGAVARRFVELVEGADEEVSAAFRQAVIVQRGQRMAARLERRLAEGQRPLVALHALHVPRILERLEAAGYRVSRAD